MAHPFNNPSTQEPEGGISEFKANSGLCVTHLTLVSSPVVCLQSSLTCGCPTPVCPLLHISVTPLCEGKPTTELMFKTKGRYMVVAFLLTADTV